MPLQSFSLKTELNKMPTRGVEMYIGLYLAREFEFLDIFAGFAGLLGKNWGFQNHFFREITRFVFDLSFTIFFSGIIKIR